MLGGRSKRETNRRGATAPPVLREREKIAVQKFRPEAGLAMGTPQGQQKDVIINYHIITLMYDNY